MGTYLIVLRNRLVLVPLFTLINLGVTGLTLTLQKPVYEAETVLECGRRWDCVLTSQYVERPKLATICSNVLSVAVSSSLSDEVCQNLSQPLSFVTSGVIRASAKFSERSRLLRLTVESHSPAMAADYANTWSTKLISRFSDPQDDVRVSMVEPAFVPTEPIAPRWGKVLLVVALIASGAGIGLVCLIAGIVRLRDLRRR